MVVPTDKRRYTITETGPVAEALERYRAAGHGAVTNSDVADLVVSGVAAQLRAGEEEQADAERRRVLRERFIQRSRTGEGIDVGALGEARERWTH